MDFVSSAVEGALVIGYTLVVVVLIILGYFALYLGARVVALGVKHSLESLHTRKEKRNGV